MSWMKAFVKQKKVTKETVHNQYTKRYLLNTCYILKIFIVVAFRLGELLPLSKQAEQVWSWMVLNAELLWKFISSCGNNSFCKSSGSPHIPARCFLQLRWAPTAFTPVSSLLSCWILQDFPKIQNNFPILRSWEIISCKVVFPIYPVKKNEKTRWRLERKEENETWLSRDKYFTFTEVEANSITNTTELCSTLSPLLLAPSGNGLNKVALIPFAILWDH